MDNAFAWVNAIAGWIGQWIPHWQIIPATHGGVKFIRGHKVIALGPGWHMYWPLTTELLMYPVVRQTIPTRTQCLVTADDKTIEDCGMITYAIHDVEAILARTYDADNTIEESAMSAIGRVCCRMSWEDLKAGLESGALNRTLRSAVRHELKPYGVTVIKATLTDMAPCRALKLIQSQSKDG